MPNCDPETQIHAIRQFNASTVTKDTMKTIHNYHRTEFQPLQPEKKIPQIY